MSNQVHVDEVTGTATTGHEWDGIRELNTPLPRWWLYTIYATIIWGIGYMAYYPAVPLISEATKGMSGWNARSEVVQEIGKLQALRGPMNDKLARTALADIRKDADLLSFASAAGAAAFATNCAPCHGAGGQGAGLCRLRHGCVRGVLADPGHQQFEEEGAGEARDPAAAERRGGAAAADSRRREEIACERCQGGTP